MNLSSIDLNLLVALDALLTEGHVGRAAQRIGRSQPAVSHSLGRLRDLLADPLLVRIGARMELTPRALVLKPMLVETLEEVRGLLAPASFDPATASRKFLVLMQDHLADLIVPSLVQRIERDAPGVRVQVLPWQSPRSMKPERLQSLDLCLSCSTEDLAGFERTALFTDTECVVARRGHPQGPRLSGMRTFLEASHVAVVGRGRTEDPVDTWLREEGLARRIVLLAPGYLPALHAVAATDLVAFVPARLAQTVEERLQLAVYRSPVDPGTYREFLFYPLRRQRDAAALWLRKILLEIGQSIEARRLGPAKQRAAAKS